MKKFKKGFTLTELLVSLGILTLVAGGVIIAMTRGASNVHRGSFNAQASNQSAWILTLLRKDIGRSSIDRIDFKPDDGIKWTGVEPFKIVLNSGKLVEYKIVKRGKGKALLRDEKDVQQQFLAAEFLDTVSIEKAGNSFKVDLLLKDPEKKSRNFSWNGRIYPPVPEAIDKYWKPFSEIKKGI